MFNPFYPFNEKLLTAFVRKGYLYLVLQSFERGRPAFQSLDTEYFLLSHYNHAGHAKMHFDALKGDRNRRLFDLTDADARHSLETLLGKTRGRIFSNLFTSDFGIRAARVLNKKYYAYVRKELKWPVSGVSAFATEYQVIFGELHVLLKLGSISRRVQLKEIEMRY